MTQESVVYIQCRDDNGKTGDFFRDVTTRVQVSPTFDSLQNLFQWARANGWRQKERVLTSTYVKD